MKTKPFNWLLLQFYMKKNVLTSLKASLPATTMPGRKFSCVTGAPWILLFKSLTEASLNKWYGVRSANATCQTEPVDICVDGELSI